VWAWSWFSARSRTGRFGLVWALALVALVAGVVWCLGVWLACVCVCLFVCLFLFVCRFVCVCVGWWACLRAAVRAVVGLLVRLLAGFSGGLGVCVRVGGGGGVWACVCACVLLCLCVCVGGSSGPRLGLCCLASHERESLSFRAGVASRDFWMSRCGSKLNLGLGLGWWCGSLCLSFLFVLFLVGGGVRVVGLCC
jgi:hypothetical protein